MLSIHLGFDLRYKITDKNKCVFEYVCALWDDILQWTPIQYYYTHPQQAWAKTQIFTLAQVCETEVGEKKRTNVATAAHRYIKPQKCWTAIELVCPRNVTLLDEGMYFGWQKQSSRGMSSCQHIVPTAQTSVYKFQVIPELVLLHSFSSRLVYPWKFTSRHTEHTALRHGWHATAESQVDEFIEGGENKSRIYALYKFIYLGNTTRGNISQVVATWEFSHMLASSYPQISDFAEHVTVNGPKMWRTIQRRTSLDGTFEETDIAKTWTANHNKQ